MEIVQIVGLGLVVTILIVLLRQQRPELATQLSIVFGVIIFLAMMVKISGIITVLKDLAVKADVNMLHMQTVLKIIGISYVAEFGAQICRDAGEGAVAAKIEFAAKIMIMILAIPILVAILESILRLLP